MPVLESGSRTGGPYIRREGAGFVGSIGVVEQKRANTTGPTGSMLGYSCRCKILLVGIAAPKQFCLGRWRMHLGLMLAISAIYEEAIRRR